MSKMLLNLLIINRNRSFLSGRNSAIYAAKVAQADKEFSLANTQLEKNAALKKKHDAQDMLNQAKINEAKQQMQQQSLSLIAGMQNSSNQHMAAIGKAAALTQIAIETPVAIGRALSSAPPPFNFALAAGVGVAMAAQTAKIAGIPLAEGGIVMPRPGGTQATIGEAGQAEAVIPLDRAGEFGLGGGVGGNNSSPCRVQVSFATATDSKRISYTGTIGGGTPTCQPPQLGLWRGKFMVFARMRQVNGSAGDITVYMRYGLEASEVTDTVNPTISGTSAATAGWPVTYMGVVTLPSIAGKAFSDPYTGRGQNQSIDENYFQIWAARSTGVGVLYLCDFVFIPMDESTVMCIPANPALTSGRGFIIDNTGFITHGQPELVVINNDNTVGSAEFRGQEIFLKPGIENRIYAWSYDQSSLLSDPNTVFNLAVNIVPRWSAIRDV